MFGLRRGFKERAPRERPKPKNMGVVAIIIFFGVIWGASIMAGKSEPQHKSYQAGAYYTPPKRESYDLTKELARQSMQFDAEREKDEKNLFVEQIKIAKTPNYLNFLLENPNAASLDELKKKMTPLSSIDLEPEAFAHMAIFIERGAKETLALPSSGSFPNVDEIAEAFIGDNNYAKTGNLFTALIKGASRASQDAMSSINRQWFAKTMSENVVSGAVEQKTNEEGKDESEYKILQPDNTQIIALDDTNKRYIYRVPNADLTRLVAASEGYYLTTPGYQDGSILIRTKDMLDIPQDISKPVTLKPEIAKKELHNFLVAFGPTVIDPDFDKPSLPPTSLMAVFNATGYTIDPTNQGSNDVGQGKSNQNFSENQYIINATKESLVVFLRADEKYNYKVVTMDEFYDTQLPQAQDGYQ